MTHTLLIELLLFLLVGAAAGILSGMLGLGGGVIVVPAITWILAITMIPESAYMHIAAGTSLAAMVVTAIASVRAHHKRGNIDWIMWKRLLPGLMVGVVFGAWLANLLDTKVLSLIFACVLLLVSIQIFFFSHVTGEGKAPGWFGASIAGIIVGMASGLLGIGGGAILIPYLLFCNYSMNRTSGTSAACVLPLAIVGAILFMITGSLHPKMHDVPYATGFIYWPAFFGIAIGSALFASVGTWLGAKANKALLKRFFAVLLFLIAIKLFIH